MQNKADFWIKKYNSLMEEHTKLKAKYKTTKRMKQYYKDLSTKPKYMPVFPNKRVRLK